MVFFVSLIPFYIFIPELLPLHTRYIPELALDLVIPLVPFWSLIYGAFYFFLILLPIFVVRQEDQIRSTVYAYLLIWITAYLFFIFYPTLAPRPEKVTGEGFAVWGLRQLYSSDPPYNCFPSLHVAHSFVSALTCYRVHRGLGLFAIACASLVAISTLFTKQHYVVDVIAGVVLALIASAIFLRKYWRERIPELDRDVAPALGVCVLGWISFCIAIYWVIYKITAIQ